MTASSCATFTGFTDGVPEAPPGALAHVVFHSVTAQRDPLDAAVAVADLLHQLVPGGVRQADVADDYVERLGGGEVEGRRGAVRGLHHIAGVLEEFGERAGGVRMVFDQEHAREGGGKAVRGLGTAAERVNHL